MRDVLRALLLAVLALGAASYPLVAEAVHKDDPSTRNIHAMGESFEAGSFLVSPATANSDLTFWGKYAFQGRYDGFRVIDISAPGNPKEVAQVFCFGNQGDVAVWGNILVRAVDRPQTLPNNDLSRACEGIDTPTGVTGFEGLQIFVRPDGDWRNASADDLVVAVPTDCGAHTHTLVPDLESNRLIVYVSVGGSAAFAGPTPYGTTCAATHPRIVAVEIPLDDPAGAHVVNNNIPAGVNGCHDVSALFAEDLKLLAGACRPSAILWDISDPVNPVQKFATTATGPTSWHSAALTWDGKVMVMGWEPGGGSQPRCQATGAPIPGGVQTDEMKSIFFFSAADGSLLGRWVLPRPQSNAENCTIHNYNILPTPKRYVLVHGSYQSGTSLVEFTDPANAVEIAYSDPHPLEPTQLGGAWSTYYYNNFIYESDITTGLRVYRVSDKVTAATMRLTHLNPQTQEFTLP